jgi:hypothetical protein
MSITDSEFWSQRLRHTLQHYDEALVRLVAGKLLRPRGQWPVAELIERIVTAVGNAAVVDRRLQDLSATTRRALPLMARSRQPRWKLVTLLEVLAALGNEDGLAPIFALFEAGLLYPDVRDLGDPLDRVEGRRLRSFEHWLGQGSAAGACVFAHPDVLARAVPEDLSLPGRSIADLTHAGTPLRVEAGSMQPAVHEADGLEWPLRLAAVWQQIQANPLRRTQQGEFYKRDLDRVRADGLWTAPSAEGLAELPEPGLLAVALAKAAGLLREDDGEIGAGPLPDAWADGLPATLAALWAALPYLDDWDPVEGYRKSAAGANPYPAAYLLALALLEGLPDGAWADPEAVEHWVARHHPYWGGPGSVSPPTRKRPAIGLGAFLLGLAYPLRLLQAAKNGAGRWLVRLSPMGRWLLGQAAAPPAVPSYAQTLLVQPNLEVVAYRQGLTPALVLDLSRFATWKSLGAACTLQLEPESVYRGLESGHTFETILQTLERHSIRPMPAAVIESLRTWSNKRERLSVYPSATLFEFASAEDLTEALARGLAGIRLAERLVLVADEVAIDFRQFRLTGTRDYLLPPERCVEVAEDGVTLGVDLARSDLFLETEMERFAETLGGSTNGRRQYRLTPGSLQAARQSGLSVLALEDWFVQRTGRALSPAGRLLLTGGEQPGPDLRRELILHVPTPDVADGLLQWPGTRSLIERRLGPTALVVREGQVEQLRECLRAIGLNL